MIVVVDVPVVAAAFPRGTLLIPVPVSMQDLFTPGFVALARTFVSAAASSAMTVVRGRAETRHLVIAPTSIPRVGMRTRGFAAADRRGAAVAAPRGTGIPVAIGAVMIGAVMIVARTRIVSRRVVVMVVVAVPGSGRGRKVGWLYGE